MKAPLLLLALVLVAGPAPAAKMMYACTGADGKVSSIQDRPCGGAPDQQRSYATPGAGGATAAPASPARATRTRKVDFTVACRSLDEERVSVIGEITASTEPRQTQRLQKRLKRIGQAQCTAKCGSC